MLISHRHKFIFVRVPRTASSSVKKSLGVFVPRNNHLKQVSSSHASIWEIRSRFYEEYRDYFKFAFVRNPWDTAVSRYCFSKHRNKYDFNTWLSMVDDYKSLTQLWMLTDDTGKLVMNFVGRFENLQKDFDKVCTRISIELYNLPHHKKSKRTNYKDYYNDKSIELITEICKKDIEQFNYEY